MQCSRVQRLKKIKASVLAMTVCVSIIAITRVKLRSQLATSDAFAIMSSFFTFSLIYLIFFCLKFFSFRVITLVGCFVYAAEAQAERLQDFRLRF